MYEYTDKVIKVLFRIAVELYGRTKARLKSDEINSGTVYDSVTYLYEQILVELKKLLLNLAGHYYLLENKKRKRSPLNEAWLDDYLLAYNTLLLIIPENELRRKQERLIEAILSAPFELDAHMQTALNLLCRQLRWMSDDITDRARVEGMKDSGVTYVMWNTQRDGRVCKECRERDRSIYRIDEVPVKPHPGCRCYLTRAKRP